MGGQSRRDPPLFAISLRFVAASRGLPAETLPEGCISKTGEEEQPFRVHGHLVPRHQYLCPPVQIATSLTNRGGREIEPCHEWRGRPGLWCSPHLAPPSPTPDPAWLRPPTLPSGRASDSRLAARAPLGRHLSRQPCDWRSHVVLHFLGDTPDMASEPINILPVPGPPGHGRPNFLALLLRRR